jgi:outer membrane receptor for ferrienterochelin and colicins
MKQRGAAWGWVGAVATLAGGAAGAQDTGQRVEINAQPLTDTEQRRRDPVARSIYGRDELDKHGDSSVTDVLKRLPGVNLQGGNPRLRGLGAGYTLILVSGEPAPPGFSLDNLSPSQVERIEVTKGPTAEHPAVAGTINIVLREAPRQRQRELRINLGYQAVRPTGSVHGTWGDRVGDFSYVLPLSAYQWHGRTATASARLSHDAQGAAQAQRLTGHDRWWGGGMNIGPRLSWKLGQADTLNLPLFAVRNAWNNQGASLTRVLQGDPPASLDDRYLSQGYWQMLRLNPQWLHRGGQGSRLELKGQWQYASSFGHTVGDGFDGSGRPVMLRDSRQRNREWQASTGGKFTRPLGEAHTLAVGWDVEARQRREVRSVTENGRDQLPGVDGQPFDTKVHRQAVYLQDEWEVAPQWSTYLGLRSEAVRTRSTGVPGAAAAESRARVLSPVWHLNHKLDPKGRDLLRFSLSRSFKAPDTAQLVGRYNLNTLYPNDRPNTEIAPDRSGNPALRPELATGIDLALEKYFAGGGLFGIGVFHRRITDLIRQRVALETVAEASAPRWVSRPVNLAGARSTGIELELKGRADELLPAAWSPGKALNLRASLSAYRSSVDGLPAPDNRLEGQQPWSLTLGFDHALGPVPGPLLTGVPLTVGASLALTPGYDTQQTEIQRQWQGGVRSLDAFALLSFSRQLQLRLAGGNLAPRDSRNTTTVSQAGRPDAVSRGWREGGRSYNASLLVKF